jgi:hypothetical protein
VPGEGAYVISVPGPQYTSAVQYCAVCLHRESCIGARTAGVLFVRAMLFLWLGWARQYQVGLFRLGSASLILEGQTL